MAQSHTMSMLLLAAVGSLICLTFMFDVDDIYCIAVSVLLLVTFVPLLALLLSFIKRLYPLIRWTASIRLRFPTRAFNKSIDSVVGLSEWVTDISASVGA